MAAQLEGDMGVWALRVANDKGSIPAALHHSQRKATKSNPNISPPVGVLLLSLTASAATGSAAGRAAVSTRCPALRFLGMPDCALLPDTLAAERLLGFGGSGKS
jgi:hypothetical protein